MGIPEAGAPGRELVHRERVVVGTAVTFVPWAVRGRMEDLRTSVLVLVGLVLAVVFLL